MTPVPDVSMQKSKHTLARTHIQAFDMAPSSGMPNPAVTDRSTQCGGDGADHDHQVTHAPTQRPHPKPLIPHTLSAAIRQKNGCGSPFLSIFDIAPNLIRDRPGGFS